MRKLFSRVFDNRKLVWLIWLLSLQRHGHLRNSSSGSSVQEIWIYIYISPSIYVRNNSINRTDRGDFSTDCVSFFFLFPFPDTYNDRINCVQNYRKRLFIFNWNIMLSSPELPMSDGSRRRCRLGGGGERRYCWRGPTLSLLTSYAKAFY